MSNNFSGPHHGHYVAVVKSSNQWILLDDDIVMVFIFSFDLHFLMKPIDGSDLCQYFGEANLGTGYFFIYNSSEYSSEKLVQSMMPDGWKFPVPEAFLASNQSNSQSTASEASGVNTSVTALQSSKTSILAPLPSNNEALLKPSIPLVLPKTSSAHAVLTSPTASLPPDGQKEASTSWSWFTKKGVGKGQSFNGFSPKPPSQ